MASWRVQALVGVEVSLQAREGEPRKENWSSAWPFGSRPLVTLSLWEKRNCGLLRTFKGVLC